MVLQFNYQRITILKYHFLFSILYFLNIGSAYAVKFSASTGFYSIINGVEAGLYPASTIIPEYSTILNSSNIYYISDSGNDNNSGTSPSEAWKSIVKVNSINFGPGDRILFKGGQTFFGNLVFDVGDSGSSGNSILVGSFGTGRARIYAGIGSGMVASSCNFLDIKNINFTGDGRKTGNTGNGLLFSNCTNIKVDSVEVRGFQHSGVAAINIGSNIQFTNINATENGFAGIFIGGLSKTSMSDIYIGYCTADNNPGDPTVTNNHSGNGMLAFNAKNVLIEYCKASNNGWDMPRTGNGPGGIWVAEVDSTIIQYCISHDNKTSVGGLDGLGFDLDGGTTNSIIQYCLSYNNYGAGYGIFQYSGATNWYNNIIRYCISENDGNISAKGSVSFWNGSYNRSQFQKLEFYNNVIYNKNGVALAFIDHLNYSFNLRNNIFVSKNKSVYNEILGEKFQGNCWYSMDNVFYLNSAMDFNDWALSNNQEMLNGKIVGMFANPMLINPGNSILTDPGNLQNLDGYKLENNSVVINKGLDLNQLFGIDPGIHDFFRNPLNIGLATDMGIYEFQGHVTETDNTNPVVSSFTLPETSATLVVRVNSITASDNVGVTGFKLTETSVAPLAGDSGWTTIAPAFYTFNSEGTKTLFAWAKDAMGNVSAGKSDQVVVTLPANDTISIGNKDVYSNIIKWGIQLAMPVTFSDTGKITSVSIYHEGGTGNLLLGVYSDQGGYPSSRLGITSSTVLNPSAGWQTVPLISPVTVNSGQKIWLSWVFQNNPGIRYATGTPGRAVSSNSWTAGMPAAFGASTIAGTKYSIYCNYISGNDLPDAINPVVSSFTLPETSATLVVRVNSITASDNVGVTGFKLTETSVAPLAGDSGWTTIAPAFYTFNSEGTKTLFAWAKDAMGNVSAGKSDQVVVTLPANDTISIGNKDVYSNIIKWGIQLAMPVTFSDTGKITSVSIYHEGGTGNLLLGVYSDQGGYPSTRLGITSSTVLNPSAGWQTVPLISQVTVNSGQKIWLSWVFQNNPGIRYATGTPGRAVSSNSWTAGMPAAFGASTIAGTKYSIYCTYITPNDQMKSSKIEHVNGKFSEIKPDIIYYPNPTSGMISVEVNLREINNLKLAFYNILGVLIKEILIGSGNTEINLSDLKNGIYFAVIRNNENGLILNSTQIVVKR